MKVDFWVFNVICSAVENCIFDFTGLVHQNSWVFLSCIKRKLPKSMGKVRVEKSGRIQFGELLLKISII